MGEVPDGVGSAGRSVVWGSLGARKMTHNVEIEIEYVITAKFVYRGVSVQVKTQAIKGYDSARSQLVAFVAEAKRGIDDAAEKAEADRQAGI